MLTTSYCTAHPRSRGENDADVEDLIEECGSSPLTRGKQRLTALVIGAVRLIPAHAGKTVSQSCMGGMAKAHPRSRGENAELMDRYTVQRGSSPLTRGKPVA